MGINPTFKKKLQFRLEKEEMVDFTARVGFSCDASGSMKHVYGSGLMNSLMEMLLVVGLKFDDNGEMEVSAFSNHNTVLPNMTEDNFKGYVDENIIRNRNSNFWGGTYFSPSIKYFVDEWFPKQEKSKSSGFFSKFFKKEEPKQEVKQEPAFLVVQTDGDLHDVDSTYRILNDIENLPMFVTFITTGRPYVSADILNFCEKFKNVQSILFEDYDSINEDKLYTDLISDKVRDFFKL